MYAACSGGVVVVALGFLVTLEAFCKVLERSTQLFIRLSRRPLIQGDEISCIRGHLK